MTEDIDADLDNVLDYKLKIDFTRLSSALKESRKVGRDNTKDVSALNTALNTLREEKDAIESRLQECVENVEKNSLSISRLNMKILELENMINKSVNDINAKNKETEEAIRSMVDERLNNSVGTMEKKFEGVTDRMDKVEQSTDTLMKKIEEKMAADVVLENKIEDLEFAVNKNIDTVK